ncbi:MAG TPA: carboxymuconolactone decarboxylase family protein [Salinivirga sp.]|uniref:carboxymuconolactone decarboxylase family protein n=1 Tax=Salinivirga sp. TaxID=1970192 RepID=UPI002B48C684|nr:carboxymuconolactone decarboxylase family protein [Salinivirga sp.]HKK59782.1 carboxymuconolactone decarboxylase family protein [Salinivirga sp.]
MSETLKHYREYRQEMNERILAGNNKVIKRIFNLDTNTYMEGALDTKTKEMLGLVSSMVLRCDDCIRYHVEQCHKLGVSKEELFEIFSVANVVGGTIVIPHLRRAVEFWDELEAEASGK